MWPTYLLVEGYWKALDFVKEVYERLHVSIISFGQAQPGSAE